MPWSHLLSRAAHDSVVKGLEKEHAFECFAVRQRLEHHLPVVERARYVMSFSCGITPASKKRMALSHASYLVERLKRYRTPFHHEGVIREVDPLLVRSSPMAVTVPKLADDLVLRSECSRSSRGLDEDIDSSPVRQLGNASSQIILLDIHNDVNRRKGSAKAEPERFILVSAENR